MAKKNPINLSSMATASDLRESRAGLSNAVKDITKKQIEEVTGKPSEEANNTSSNILEGQPSSKLTKISKKTETILSLSDNIEITEVRISNPIGESYDNKIQAIATALSKIQKKKVYKKQVIENIMTNFFNSHITEIKELIENSRDQDNAF